MKRKVGTWDQHTVCVCVCVPFYLLKQLTDMHDSIGHSNFSFFSVGSNNNNNNELLLWWHYTPMANYRQSRGIQIKRI